MVPDQPAAWPAHRAAARALGRVERALATAPDDVGLLFDRGRLLDRLGSADAARQAYLDVLARDHVHAGALANLEHHPIERTRSIG